MNTEVSKAAILQEEIPLEKSMAAPGTASVQGMTAKVIKGSFWVLIGQLLPLFATFLATPFVIRYLGSEAYGVLILVGLVSSYFSFGDFGMGLTSTKFGAEAYAEHAEEKEGLTVRTAAAISFFSSLVIAIPMFAFSGWIVGDLLKVPDHLYRQASVALKITSIAFVLSFLSNIINSPQLARMKMGTNVLINAGFKVLMILTTPIVFYLGGSIIEACIVTAVTAVLILTGHIIASGRLLPQLYKWTFSSSLFGPLMKYGRHVVLFGIGVTIINNLEKLLLARLVLVKFLAYYSVAFTFANMTTMFSMAMVQTLIPAFSQLLSPDKRSALNALFNRCLRISMMVLVPSIMVLLILGKPFFTIWAGKEFGLESTLPFYILLVGIFFSILVYVPNCILMSTGRSDLFGKFYLAEIIPYAALSFILIRNFGILGAAAAWSIREIVNAFFFIMYTKKVAGITFDVKSELKALLPGILIFLPAAIFALFVDNFSPWLIAMVPLSLAAYVWFMWKKVVDPDEKKWLMERINGLFRSR